MVHSQKLLLLLRLIKLPSSSAQITELQAVIAVFSVFSNQHINIYMDIAYLVHSAPLLETVGQIKHISQAGKLFQELQILIRKKIFLIFFLFFRSTCVHIQKSPDPLLRIIDVLTWPLMCNSLLCKQVKRPIRLHWLDIATNYIILMLKLFGSCNISPMNKLNK